MPAPPAALVTSLALPHFVSGSIPQQGTTLARAVGGPIGEACRRFTHRVHMSAGVPCMIQPTSFSGQVTGQGRLLGSPPSADEIRIEAANAARSEGVAGADRDRFAEAVARLTAVGLDRFRGLAMVLPGTPIAGGTTAAPAQLSVPVQAIRAELDALARTLTPSGPDAPGAATPGGGGSGASRPEAGPPGGGSRTAQAQAPGVPVPADLESIVAKVVAATMGQMATMLMIAPGIPVAGSATAGPGMLM